MTVWVKSQRISCSIQFFTSNTNFVTIAYHSIASPTKLLSVVEKKDFKGLGFRLNRLKMNGRQKHSMIGRVNKLMTQNLIQQYWRSKLRSTSLFTMKLLLARNRKEECSNGFLVKHRPFEKCHKSSYLFVSQSIRYFNWHYLVPIIGDCDVFSKIFKFYWAI